jgi:F0F1-type ATP synthase membrane subunit c/vacuolar-type H+-ATPase subunit K
MTFKRNAPHHSNDRCPTRYPTYFSPLALIANALTVGIFGMVTSILMGTDYGYGLRMRTQSLQNRTQTRFLLVVLDEIAWTMSDILSKLVER